MNPIYNGLIGHVYWVSIKQRYDKPHIVITLVVHVKPAFKGDAAAQGNHFQKPDLITIVLIFDTLGPEHIATDRGACETRAMN